MENTTQQQEQLNGKLSSKENFKLGSAINHAVQMESLFKLYSYRILDHKQFLEQVTDLNKILTKDLK